MVETFSILLPRTAFQIHGVFSTHNLSEIQPTACPVLSSSHIRLVAATKMAQTSRMSSTLHRDPRRHLRMCSALAVEGAQSVAVLSQREGATSVEKNPPSSVRSWKEPLLTRVVLESRLRACAIGRHREPLNRDARIGNRS